MGPDTPPARPDELDDTRPAAGNADVLGAYLEAGRLDPGPDELDARRLQARARALESEHRAFDRAVAAFVVYVRANPHVPANDPAHARALLAYLEAEWRT